MAITDQHQLRVKLKIGEREDYEPIFLEVKDWINGWLISLPPSGIAGGRLTGTYPNPLLANSGVISGTYGSASSVAMISVSDDGTLYEAADVPIQISEAQVTNLVADLAAKEAALTFSTGLLRTGNTITAKLATGFAGGQSVIGGAAASENLTLSSTSHATKGKIAFGNSVYNESNNRLGINTIVPSYPLHVASSSSAPQAMIEGTASSARMGVNASANAGFGFYISSALKWSLACVNNFGGSNTDMLIYNDAIGAGALAIDGNTNNCYLGDGGTEPTARLHIKAGTGTTKTAPIKLTSGTLNSTPEAGAIEYSGTELSFTASSAVRRAVAMWGSSRSGDRVAYTDANGHLLVDNGLQYDGRTLYIVGNATHPQLRIGSQSLVTAAAGTIEYDGVNLFHCDNTPTRRTVVEGNSGDAPTLRGEVSTNDDCWGADAKYILCTPNLWMKIPFEGRDYMIPLYDAPTI